MYTIMTDTVMYLIHWHQLYQLAALPTIEYWFEGSFIIATKYSNTVNVSFRSNLSHYSRNMSSVAVTITALWIKINETSSTQFNISSGNWKSFTVRAKRWGDQNDNFTKPKGSSKICCNLLTFRLGQMKSMLELVKARPPKIWWSFLIPVSSTKTSTPSPSPYVTHTQNIIASKHDEWCIVCDSDSQNSKKKQMLAGNYSTMIAFFIIDSDNTI